MAVIEEVPDQAHFPFDRATRAADAAHAAEQSQAQALCILTRAAFVAGEYIPLKFLTELAQNAPLQTRIRLYVLAARVKMQSAWGDRNRRACSMRSGKVRTRTICTSIVASRCVGVGCVAEGLLHRDVDGERRNQPRWPEEETETNAKGYLSGQKGTRCGSVEGYRQWETQGSSKQRCCGPQFPGLLSGASPRAGGQ